MIMTDSQYNDLEEYGIVGAAVGLGRTFNAQWEEVCYRLLGKEKYLESRKAAVDKMIREICETISAPYLLPIEVNGPARAVLDELMQWMKITEHDDPQYIMYMDAVNRITQALEERNETDT